MAFFTAAQLAILSQTTVRVATLAELNFNPVMRLWNGSYPLTTGGYEWTGLGRMARIEGLYETRSAESQQVKFILPGPDPEVNRIATSSTALQVNKLARCFFQLFDAAWTPVGSPIAIWSGLTQASISSKQIAEDGEGHYWSVTLPCENLFSARSRPPAGLYTDPDQQSDGRFPGDLFFEHIARLKSFTYEWP